MERLRGIPMLLRRAALVLTCLWGLGTGFTGCSPASAPSKIQTAAEASAVSAAVELGVREEAQLTSKDLTFLTSHGLELSDEQARAWQAVQK